MLLAVQNINFIPNSGILDDIFHKSWLAVSIAGFPAGGYKVTLIGLVIIMIIAIAANGITERLTGKKVGGMLAAVLVAVLGCRVFQGHGLAAFGLSVGGLALIGSRRA